MDSRIEKEALPGELSVDSRLSEFQRNQDVLAGRIQTLESGHSRQSVRFINSPLFLWVISAVFLSLAGVAFSNYQDCMRDAQRDIEALHKLQEETYYRMRCITFSVDRASTVKDFRDRFKASPYVFGEFKDATIRELRIKQGRLVDELRVVPATLDAVLVKFGFKPLVASNEEFAKYVIERGIEYGFLPSTYTDRDLPGAREMAHKIWNNEKAVHRLFRNSELSPSCSLPTILDRTRGIPYKSILIHLNEKTASYEMEDKVDMELDGEKR